MCCGRQLSHPVCRGVTVFDRIARFQRRAQTAGVGVYRQGVVIALHATGQRDQTTGAIIPGNRTRSPRRRSTSLVWQYPDLEKARGDGLPIVFGFADSRPSAHHLHIPGHGLALIAQTDLVGNGPWQGPGAVLSTMRRYAGAYCTLTGSGNFQVPSINSWLGWYILTI